MFLGGAVCASQQNSGADVRFGSKADILGGSRDVRFTPKSGHWPRVTGCPVCANKPHHATIQNSAIGVAFALSCHRNMPTFREIKGSGCAFGGQEPRR